MARISKYHIDKNLEKEIFYLFWSSLAKLKTSSEIATFFSDLLSDTEEMMLAKRFTIALLLKNGKTPTQISQILHVSFSMIKGVNEWLAHASPSTTNILHNTQKVQTFESIFDTVTMLLDKQQPRWGTDWSKAGKEKWQRNLERLSRNKLR